MRLNHFSLLDYLNLNSGSCVDLAATYDCELKKQQGLCHLILGNNQPVYVFCAKTCGYCPHEPYLTCAKLAPNTCQMGQCVDVRLFDVPTIKCVCPQSRGGAYCQISNLLHLFDIHGDYFDFFLNSILRKSVFIESLSKRWHMHSSVRNSIRQLHVSMSGGLLGCTVSNLRPMLFDLLSQRWLL